MTIVPCSSVFVPSMTAEVLEMILALTRAVPLSIDRCELTHLAREPIDYARAVRAARGCTRRH